MKFCGILKSEDCMINLVMPVWKGPDSPVLAGSRIFFQVSAIYSRIFSDSVAGGVPVPEPSGELISAMISPSALWKLLLGLKPRLKLKKWKSARNAMGIDANRGQARSPAGNVAVWGRLPEIRVFSPYDRPARFAGVKARPYAHPCTTCRGSGQVAVSKKVSVKIPAGVDTGSRLRLTGEGEPGRLGGPQGDLYVFIYVEDHEFFQRHDNNIICTLPISFVQACLGDKINVPTLNGDKKLQIPKGTQPGDVLYFRGEGIPSLQTGRRGDQIIQVEIKTPTHLSKKQESLLREFAALESGKLSKKLKNILKGGISQASN